MVLPVLNRYTTPLTLELSGKTRLSRSTTIGEAVAWLSVLSDGKSMTAELPLFSTELERRRYLRDHDPLPLPKLPKHKVKRPKTQQKQSTDSSYDKEMRAVEAQQKSDSLARTQMPGTIEGALVIQMRWTPGMSARHRDVVYDAPRHVRDAFQMWLFRHDNAADLAPVASKESRVLSKNSKASDDSWIDDELEELGASGGLTAKQKEKLRVRKPGSAGWIAHGMKVIIYFSIASHRLRLTTVSRLVSKK